MALSQPATVRSLCTHQGAGLQRPKLDNWLMSPDDRICFKYARTGLAKGDCVRVTPALYNSSADVDKLARAVTTLTRIVARG